MESHRKAHDANKHGGRPHQSFIQPCVRRCPRRVGGNLELIPIHLEHGARIACNRRIGLLNQAG